MAYAGSMSTRVVIVVLVRYCSSFLQLVHVGYGTRTSTGNMSTTLYGTVRATPHLVQWYGTREADFPCIVSLYVSDLPNPTILIPNCSSVRPSVRA